MILNVLYIIKQASLRSLISADLPIHKTSLLPLIRLFFLFETVMLAPPSQDKPRQYRKLIPIRIQQFRSGDFVRLYKQAYKRPIQPIRQTTITSQSINKTVETAVRAGDYSTALARLTPQPRAILTDSKKQY
jgi:hypothetical protein